MRDSNELRDYHPDRNVTGFTLSWLFWVIGIVVVLGAVGWVLRWASVPGQVVSPENVRAQWAFAYQYDESLQAAARQICAARRAKEESTDANERTQRASQLIALEQNYARIQAEYNARLRDAFQAKLIAPADVPERAPELEAVLAGVCTP
jgi:hypothetical protein